MIETLALAVRGAHAGASVIVLGTTAFLALMPCTNANATLQWRARWLGIALWSAAALLLLCIALLAIQATSLAQGRPALETAITLLERSRFGHVLLMRFGLIAALIASLIYVRSRALQSRTSSFALALLAAVTFSASAWSGHSAAEEPAGPALSAHVLHLTSLSVWLGALPALYALIVSADRKPTELALAARTFTRFSRLAMTLMPLIVISGVGLAVVHVRDWPALFGTRYGALVLTKSALLIGVLLIAARIRWRYLGRYTQRAATSDGLRRALRFEIALGFGIVIVAATLAQTIPARHDAIQWLLPFRVSIDATGELPDMHNIAWAGAIVAMSMFILCPILWWRRKSIAMALAAALGGAPALVSLWALSVEAYPDTYRKPSIPYQTVSVVRGAAVFAKHCVSCHGVRGTGDGPSAQGMRPAPANLTEPHTALHTAGDIFRWLTVGKPPSAMPGFATQLTEDDRWDTINFLRTLSVGYQARIVTDRVVPLKPWLGAIDFDFVDQLGQSGTLKDYRERAVVLLVLHTGSTESLKRIEQLESMQAKTPESAAIIVASRTRTESAGPVSTIRIVTEDADSIIDAYALLRRTLLNPDADNVTPVPAHQEFLVDRFGYLRARWNPVESDAWRDLSFLQSQAALLAAEKKVREPPDDHVH